MQLLHRVLHFLGNFIKMLRRFAKNFSLHIFLDIPQDLSPLLLSFLHKFFHRGGQVVQIVIEGGGRAHTEDREREEVKLEDNKNINVKRSS